MTGGLMQNPPGYEDDPDEDELFEGDESEDGADEEAEPEFKAGQGNSSGKPFKPEFDRRDLDEPQICGPLWSPQPRD